MGWFKNMGGFFGYIIGAVITLPLILIGYNCFFINKNDGEKVLKPYISNSKEILLTIPDYNNSPIPNDNSFISDTHTTSMQTKNMGRDGSKSTSIKSRVIYSTVMKKYFKIIMFDWYRSFWYEIYNKEIYGKVNNEDLSNQNLGTKEKPILIFSVRRADNKPMKNINLNGDSVSYDITAEQYQYNVAMYLTYIMPKKEFKERFEKK